MNNLLKEYIDTTKPSNSPNQYLNEKYESRMPQ